MIAIWIKIQTRNAVTGEPLSDFTYRQGCCAYSYGKYRMYNWEGMEEGEEDQFGYPEGNAPEKHLD